MLWELHLLLCWKQTWSVESSIEDRKLKLLTKGEQHFPQIQAVTNFKKQPAGRCLAWLAPRFHWLAVERSAWLQHTPQRVSFASRDFFCSSEIIFKSPSRLGFNAFDGFYVNKSAFGLAHQPVLRLLEKAQTQVLSFSFLTSLHQ